MISDFENVFDDNNQTEYTQEEQVRQSFTKNFDH